VIFDETTPCPRDVFECACDKEIEEIIFVDEELHGFDGDEDEPLLPSTSSIKLVPASTLFSRGSSGYYLFHSSSGGVTG
jgi:hypothetical protein